MLIEIQVFVEGDAGLALVATSKIVDAAKAAGARYGVLVETGATILSEDIEDVDDPH